MAKKKVKSFLIQTREAFWYQGSTAELGMKIEVTVLKMSFTTVYQALVCIFWCSHGYQIQKGIISICMLPIIHFNSVWTKSLECSGLMVYYYVGSLRIWKDCMSDNTEQTRAVCYNLSNERVQQSVISKTSNKRAPARFGNYWIINLVCEKPVVYYLIFTFNIQRAGLNCFNDYLGFFKVIVSSFKPTNF